MANVNDYFEYDGYCSPADIVAQESCNDVWEAFDELCGIAGLKRTSDWGYCSPCRGTEAWPDCESWQLETWEPREVTTSDFKWPDVNAVELCKVWNEWCERLIPMYKWLDRTAWHLDGVSRYDWWEDGHDGYKHRRDRKLNERRDAVVDAYIDLIDEACDALANKVDELFNAECDYAYSDEAAQEWADCQIA